MEKDKKDDDNESDGEEENGNDSSAIFTPSPKKRKTGVVNGTSGIPIVTLPCKVRVSSGLANIKQARGNNDQMEASVQIIDFPASEGPSLLEVTRSSSHPSASTSPIFTAVVGLRLAFSLPPELDGGRTLHVFLFPYSSSIPDGANPEDCPEVENEIQMYQIELCSLAAANRLYRCLLLRLSRFFMENEQSSTLESHSRKRKLSDHNAGKILVFVFSILLHIFPA